MDKHDISEEAKSLFWGAVGECDCNNESARSGMDAVVEFIESVIDERDNIARILPWHKDQIAALRRESAQWKDRAITAINYATEIADHAEACGIVRSPAYDLAVQRVRAVRECDTPIPGLLRDIAQWKERAEKAERRVKDLEWADAEWKTRKAEAEHEKQLRILARTDERDARADADALAEALRDTVNLVDAMRHLLDQQRALRLESARHALSTHDARKAGG